MKANALRKIPWQIPLLLALTMAALVPGYYRNTWLAVGPKRFPEWRMLTEDLVVGRLAQSRQGGVFSYGGLLGWGDRPALTICSLEIVAHQYEIYETGGRFSQFLPYPSSIGGQGILYSLFDQATDFTSACNLKIFRGIATLLTGATLALLVLWFFHEFGTLAALLPLGYMLMSEWLTFYGGSIYYVTWNYFLPAVAVGMYLSKTSTSRQAPTLPWLLILGSLLFKFLLTGFELVTSTLLMVAVPIVYYALRDRWGTAGFLTFSIKTAALGAAAVLLATGILLIQGASAQGSWFEAVNCLLFTIGKRTAGDPDSYGGLVAESLRAGVPSVVWTYLNGRSINFPVARLIPFETDLPKTFDVSYLAIFTVFLAVSVLFWLLHRGRGGFPRRSTLLALTLTCWLSALIPLTWFVLFKAHSYIHTQLDFIVWDMPFTLMGFAMCGALISSAAAGFLRREPEAIH